MPTPLSSLAEDRSTERTLTPFRTAEIDPESIASTTEGGGGEGGEGEGGAGSPPPPLLPPSRFPPYPPLTFLLLSPSLPLPLLYVFSTSERTMADTASVLVSEAAATAAVERKFKGSDIRDKMDNVALYLPSSPPDAVDDVVSVVLFDMQKTHPAQASVKTGRLLTHCANRTKS